MALIHDGDDAGKALCWLHLSEVRCKSACIDTTYVVKALSHGTEIAVHSMMQMHTNTPSWPAAAYQASVLKPSVSFHASHELHMLLSTYRQQSLHIAEDAPLGMTPPA